MVCIDYDSIFRHIAVHPFKSLNLAQGCVNLAVYDIANSLHNPSYGTADCQTLLPRKSFPYLKKHTAMAKYLQNERGEANYFSTVVFIFITVLLFAFIIDLFSIISTKQQLDHCADQMVKQIQLSGGTNGETDALFQYLCSQINGANNITYTIDQSGLLRKISEAAFRRQDMDEADRLASDLKGRISLALAPFYESHIRLYMKKAPPGTQPPPAGFYNEAPGCIWQDGAWVPMEIGRDAVLLPVQDITKAAA